jgi:lysophospholipase L1-like esterase
MSGVNEMKVYIIGDSTASIKLDNKRPEAGWGEYIHCYLDPKVTIINKAVNGRSTKSFVELGHLDFIDQLTKDDVVIIQFGHNDQKRDDPVRFCEPLTTYQTNLSNLAKLVKQQGATPMIFSSIPRRNFLSQHRMIADTVGQYPAAAKALALREGIIFVDVYQRLKRLFEYLGDDLSKGLLLHLKVGESPNYPDGLTDNTHLNLLGAKVVASFIAESLVRKYTPLTNYVEVDKLLTKIQVKRLLRK